LVDSDTSMTTPHQQTNNNADDDLELLSAYLDNQLAVAERVQLEQRLHSEPELRTELEELRAMTVALRDLAPVMPPRSFTLDPAQVPPRRPWYFLPGWMRLGGALATLLIAVTTTFLLVFNPTSQTASQPPMAAMEPPAEAMLQSEPAADTMRQQQGDERSDDQPAIARQAASNSPVAATAESYDDTSAGAVEAQPPEATSVAGSPGAAPTLPSGADASGAAALPEAALANTDTLTGATPADGSERMPFGAEADSLETQAQPGEAPSSARQNVPAMSVTLFILLAITIILILGILVALWLMARQRRNE
jgi:hypothetical protein